MSDEAGLIAVGDGTRLSYVFEGPADAPTLVLAHSLGADRTMWDPQIHALASRYRILRYDSRGHGRSDAPLGAYGMDRLGQDAVDLMDALDVEAAVFCGVSMGGMVAQWLGPRMDGRLRGLVLANTSPRMAPAAGWQARIASVSASGMESVADAVLARWFTPGFAQREPDQVARVRERLIATSTLGYVGCCCAIRDMDHRPSLASISSPTLVIAGRHDAATPPEHARLLAEAIKSASYQELEAAHLSNVEAAVPFTRTLVNFLDEIAV